MTAWPGKDDLPKVVDDMVCQRQFMDCRDCGDVGYHTSQPGCVLADNECPICGRVLGTSNGEPSCDQCGPIDYDEVIDTIVDSIPVYTTPGGITLGFDHGVTADTESLVWAPTQTIYFDPVDAEADGNGWNVIDGGSIAARFATKDEATGWCDTNGLPYEVLPDDGSVNVQAWLLKPLWDSAIRAMRNLANASADAGDEAVTGTLDDLYDRLNEAHDAVFGGE